MEQCSQQDSALLSQSSHSRSEPTAQTAHSSFAFDDRAMRKFDLFWQRLTELRRSATTTLIIWRSALTCVAIRWWVFGATALAIGSVLIVERSHATSVALSIMIVG